jgi:hypothetical protein
MNVRGIAGLVLLVTVGSHAAAAGAYDRRVDDVAEAVFRQQLSLWLEGAGGYRETVLCLAIERGSVAESVSREFLQRFKDQAAVRAQEDCEGRKDGAIERATGRPAILVTVGAMKWLDTDEAQVTVNHFRSQLVSGTRSYRVVWERSRWICLGQVIDVAPS